MILNICFKFLHLEPGLISFNGFQIVKDKIEEGSKGMQNSFRAYVGASSGETFSSFTPLESHTINGGNNINKASIPKRMGRVKVPTR
jgi:hypothetical protein